MKKKKKKTQKKRLNLQGTRKLKNMRRETRKKNKIFHFPHSYITINRRTENAHTPIFLWPERKKVALFSLKELAVGRARNSFQYSSQAPRRFFSFFRKSFFCNIEQQDIRKSGSGENKKKVSSRKKEFLSPTVYVHTRRRRERQVFSFPLYVKIIALAKLLISLDTRACESSLTVLVFISDLA